jgi:prevent-host-death family protein
MTRTYNIHEAKTQLSKLLAQVRKGDEVFIAKAGKTCAKLIPAAAPLKKPRQLGTARGMGMVPDNFNDPDPELEDLFYNGPIFSEPLESLPPSRKHNL